jgi:hypothetical protein
MLCILYGFRCRSTGVVFEPASGQLLPATAETGYSELEITASVTVQDAGTVAGDVNISLGQGTTDVRKVAYAVTAVKQSFELLDTEKSAHVTEVRFDTFVYSPVSEFVPLPASLHLLYVVNPRNLTAVCYFLHIRSGGCW